MLNIVVVQTGNYCGRGAEYVHRIYDGIDKHIGNSDIRAWCLTDDPATLPAGVEPIEPIPGITGWWNKISLFRPGLFEGRVLYFDLDMIICGDISYLANYQGKFAILSDPYHPKHMNSSIMAWRAGAVDHIWDAWDAGGRPQFDRRGDQRWIESVQPEADYWQDMFPGKIISFKAHYRPSGYKLGTASIVLFHGYPRPHQINFAVPPKLEMITEG